jgi:hypothetical protein
MWTGGEDDSGRKNELKRKKSNNIEQGITTVVNTGEVLEGGLAYRKRTSIVSTTE